MKIHNIDNSLKNLGKTVLWQYDRAIRLLAILKHMQVLFHCAVEQFWDFWTNKVLSIETCGSFGCTVWGMFLGVSRPIIVDNGHERPVVSSVYRRILKGAFYLMKSSSSYEDILGYIEMVFGIEGQSALSKWSVHVSEYGWTTNIEELNSDNKEVAKYVPRLAYKKDMVFLNEELGSRWLCLKNIKATENTSFEEIRDRGLIEETMQPPTVISESSTLLLKLYDPEGVCRKISGAPTNSLKISVTYKFGEKTITAEATRRRKCGISLTDNGDMTITYGKSEYYEEMHKDQKYIYEQLHDEFCPYPLGIKTNAPVPEWVLGCIGQENEQYERNKAYAQGYIFGYADDKGNCYNYICNENITAGENTSFEAIKGKISITSKGNPFVGGLVDTKSPILSLWNREETSRIRHTNQTVEWHDLNNFAASCSASEQDKVLFLSYLQKMVDVSTLNYPATYSYVPNVLCIIKRGDIRLVAITQAPTAHVFYDGDSIIQSVLRNRIVLTSKEIMLNEYNEQVWLAEHTTRLLYKEQDFINIERYQHLRGEIERCLGVIAEKENWKILGAAESFIPLESINYLHNGIDLPQYATFEIDGQKWYFKNSRELKLLAQTTIASNSTLLRL